MNLLKRSQLLTEQSDPLTERFDPPTVDQATTIVPVLNPADQATIAAAATTPLMTPQNTPLPIKVFPDIALSVQVRKGSQEWNISGIADWVMGYGKRAVLEDGAVLLAVEAKRQRNLFGAEAQLLTYLAIIRQLRIQARKKNVMTQGFYSDGGNYKFLCICNNGTVIRSKTYNVVNEGDLRLVFNFLLNILNTAAESSLHTSPVKPGVEQEERIQNLDQEVFVEVCEDISRVSTLPLYGEGPEGEEMPPDIEIVE